jgi:cyanate permease
MLTPSTRAIASAAKNTVETLLFLTHAFQSTVAPSFLSLIAWLLSPDRTSHQTQSSNTVFKRSFAFDRFLLRS